MAVLVSELLTKLTYRLNDPEGAFWITSEKISYLDEGHRYITNYWKWPWRLRVSTITLTADQSSYSVPTDLQGEDLHSLYFSSTAHNCTDQILVPETLNDYQIAQSNATITSGIPSKYHLAYDSTGALKIVLYPPPDFTQTDALSVRYYATATTLDETTDAVMCPDEMIPLLLDFAFARCKEKEQENSIASDISMRLEGKLALIKTAYISGNDENLNMVRTPYTSESVDLAYGA